MIANNQTNLKTQQTGESDKMQVIALDNSSSPSSKVSLTSKLASKWTRKKKITIFALLLILVGLCVSIPFIVISFKKKNSTRSYKKNINQEFGFQMVIDEQQQDKTLSFFKFQQNKPMRLLSQDSGKVDPCENLIISHTNQKGEQESKESYFRCGDQKEWIQLNENDNPYSNKDVSVQDMSDLTQQQEESSEMNLNQIYGELNKQITSPNNLRNLQVVGIHPKGFERQLPCGGLVKMNNYALLHRVFYRLKVCNIFFWWRCIYQDIYQDVLVARVSFETCIRPCNNLKNCKYDCINSKCECGSECFYCPANMYLVSAQKSFCGCNANFGYFLE